MDVTLPNGYVVRNVPDNVTKTELKRKVIAGGLARLEDFDPPLSRSEYVPRVISKPEPDSSFFGDIASGFGAGVVGMYESSALGAAAVLEEKSELAARDKIKSIAEAFRPEGGDPDSVTYKLSSGLGSIAALLPAGLLGPAALPVAGAVAAGAGAGEASERARDYGATEAERSSAALRGTLIGATEIAPLGRVFSVFNKIPGLNKVLDKLGPESIESIGDRILSAGGTGVAEGLQEGAAAILQNLNERGYNPEKELVDAGVLEEAAIGGGAGAILQGLVDVLGGKKTKSTSDVTEEDPDDAAISEEARERLGFTTEGSLRDQPELGMPDSREQRVRNEAAQKELKEAAASPDSLRNPDRVEDLARAEQLTKDLTASTSSAKNFKEGLNETDKALLEEYQTLIKGEQDPVTPATETRFTNRGGETKKTTLPVLTDSETRKNELTAIPEEQRSISEKEELAAINRQERYGASVVDSGQKGFDIAEQDEEAVSRSAQSARRKINNAKVEEFIEALPSDADRAAANELFKSTKGKQILKQRILTKKEEGTRDAPAQRQLGLEFADADADADATATTGATVDDTTGATVDDTVDNTVDATVNATPGARALAAEKGIELADITGTGKGGKITVSDVTKVIPKETTVGDIYTTSEALNTALVSAGIPENSGLFKIVKDARQFKKLSKRTLEEFNNELLADSSYPNFKPLTTDNATEATGGARRC